MWANCKLPSVKQFRWLEVQGGHAKQSGGRGQYGDVWVCLEPNEPGKGFEFIDEIKVVVPQEYRAPVQKRH